MDAWSPGPGMRMKLVELAARSGMKMLAAPAGAADGDVSQVYGGHAISDLLDPASPTTPVATGRASSQLLRVAHLMDVPGLSVVNGRVPRPTLIRAAQESGTALLLSPFDLAETCGRLSECLRREVATGC